MRRRRRLVFLTLAITALAVGCSKKHKEEDDDEESTPATTAAAPTKAEKAAETPKGFGTVKGTVAFAGKAPEMPALPRQSDPICAAKPMKSNEVVVNSNKTLNHHKFRFPPGEVKGKFSAPDKPVFVKQQDCMYVPRVQGAVAGETVQVENTDKTMHNVHTYKGQETVLNQGQPAGSPPIKKDNVATEASILKFKCDVHPWMTGYLVVNDNPFFQTTGDDGSFTLDKVPVGTYTLEAWHSRFGLKTTKVTVEADKTVEAKFSYDGTEKAAE
jgi:plastocyanin